MFASTAHYNYVNLVSRAVIPLESSKPNKPKLLIMALLFSLVAGFAVPAAYELFLNRRIRVTEDLERSFGIPVLAEFDVIEFAAGPA
jgi:capsular polysaccharide biosynthesis protein